MPEPGEYVRLAFHQLSHEMQNTRANRRPDEKLPGKSRNAKQSAPMLENDKRFIERDIHDAR